MYSPPGYADILEELIHDFRNRRPNVDVRPGSELYIRLAVTAGALWGAYQGVRYVEDQAFPETADTANLERWASRYALERQDAVAASDGQIELTGVNGTVVSAGLALAYQDGTAYTTTTGGTIAGGVLLVSAEADEGGLAGNRAAGDALTVSAPPAGVDPTATVDTAFTTGTDAESNAQLLDRVLTRIRRGNAGGTASDYEQWARSVDGVAFATCLPLRRGGGTVSVAIFTADSEGRRVAANHLLRIDVLNYIETVRPVCADVDIPAVTETSVDVTITGLVMADGLGVGDVQAAIEAAIGDAIYATGPGDTLYRVQLIRAIGSVEGVYNFALTAPAADVVSVVNPTDVEVLVPGTILMSA